MIQLVHGTIETLNVTVVDTTGVLTTLDTLNPRYTVVPLDASGNNKGPYYYKYFNKAALNSGMMIQALINTTLTTQYNTVEATSAPTLPVTITAGSNDTFKWNTVAFTIPAGTYTTLAALAAAMMLSVDGSANVLYSTRGVYVDVTDNGKLTLVNDMVINTSLGFYDATSIQNGATHNALPTLGFTNGQTMATYNASVVSAWALGNYDLYVSFTSGSEKPLLGPVPFQVI